VVGVRTVRILLLIALVAPAAVLAGPGARTLARPGEAANAAPVSLPGENEVAERTLPNGLKLLVWPDHDIPNVVIYDWVRVGSRNEKTGATGHSHFFEHMMFEGTTKHPHGEFDRLMEDAGGSNNAFTTEDMTVYQDWIPRSALELVFDLESDRLQHLDFAPEVVENERNVVYSERRSSVEDDPGGLLTEQVQATAFVAHPYGNPVIGWPSDIEAWTLDDLMSYFRVHYAPNNCTFVIVGDVKPEEIFALAERYLAPIPAQPPTPALRTVEPEQHGERTVKLVLPAQTPLLYLAYKSPAGADPEGPALDMLLDILAGGDYARLHRLLVEDAQVAIAVDVQRQSGFDPGLTWIDATLPAGGDPARVEQMIDDALASVVRDGVTEKELTRAKNIVTAAFVRGLATIDGKAGALGSYEMTYGDWRRLFRAPAEYAAVTAADIRKVAAAVFDPDRRTVGVLEPKVGNDESEPADGSDDDAH
jgi:zinc protease